MSELSSEREQTATPTLEKRDINWNQLNDSVMSGYEGDKEDEDESFFDRGEFLAFRFHMLFKKINYIWLGWQILFPACNPYPLFYLIN